MCMFFYEQQHNAVGLIIRELVCWQDINTKVHAKGTSKTEKANNRNT